jgi:hypothetical protein
MDTPNKKDQHCPGPAKSSRVESLRARRELLRKEIKRVTARLAESEAKAQNLLKIEARRRDRAERELLGSLCKRVGLDRYRLHGDASNPDAPASLEIFLIAGALSWLSKRMSVMSPEDMDVMREGGSALVEEIPGKGDAAHEKRDAHNAGTSSTICQPSSAFKTT